ncbi:MFS transporter [Shinella sp. HZN7]|uniref:MFS transporter n=1 Tax=Shinella sp. (strain HZN7) TaxID=879274 RepID=UPI0007DA82A7|nr:MFS transporter [Shinella sp. HZN7]ANH03009.1 MFS transporter [Shinella sp. HZN7]
MATLAPTSAPVSTRWGAVSLLVGAGVVAALQVGKTVIAIPMLQSDMGLDLAAIGWLTGVFAVLGLVGGISAGALVASFGARRILLLGLLITAIGAAHGATVSSFAPLLISRIGEGAGFLLITVAAPSVLEHVTERSRRDLAFALWSCFMPAGMAIAMLAGPLFSDWRAIWWASSLLALVVAVMVVFVISTAGRRARWSWSNLGKDAATTILTAGPLLLALAFACYSLMFFALFGFLPVLLMERMQVSHQTAGLLSAMATAANIAGNLAAGVLLSRGVARASLIAWASLAMGIGSFGIFLPALPDGPTFMLCVMFSAVGGLIPATLLSTAPLAAPAAGLVPVVLGLVVQGNNLGQIAGPVAVGRAIQTYGWPSAALIVALAACMAAMIAGALGRALRRTANPGRDT